jgi:phage/plasmid-associated DNA primase
MDPRLSELIHNSTNSTGIPVASYKSLFGISSKFTITANKFGEFINGYCEFAYEDEKMDEGNGIPPTKLCIAECLDGKSTLPIIGDFHLKFQVEEGDEERSYYGEDFALRVIKCYQQAMSELLNLSPGLSEYICCVLEGHTYRNNSDYVHKHIVFQFPFCQVDIQYQKKIFRPYVEKLLRTNKVMQSFDTEPVGGWNEIISDIKEYYPLYRSTIRDNMPHLSLNHIYGLIEDEHIDSSECPDIPLSIFGPGNHSFIYNRKVPEGSIPEECPEDEDEDEYRKFWLPLFLSIHFYSGQTLPKEIEAKKGMEKGPRGPYEIDEMDSDNPIRMAHSLLPLLNVDRANKDYSWLDIGRTLHNITKGSEEGLNMWVNFSSRSSEKGRDKNMCTYKYGDLGGSNLSIKTIAWYAKEDNIGGYNEWHSNWCQKSLNDSLSASHADVSKSIYRFYWLDYVYSAETCCWYQYRGHHFYRVGREPIVLRKAILEQFVGIYEKMRADISAQVLTIHDDLSKRNLEAKIGDINKLILRLKNENYRTTIVKATKDLFHVEEFEKLCDKNIYLTALNNCVLEVVEKKVRPRAGKPEDYVLKFSQINYPFDYSWDSYWVKEVVHWFNQITVGDKELKHYFFKRLSSFLRGLNPEKLFDVWTNEGNGGKSMLAKTIQYIFGSYFIDFPTSLLTAVSGKNSSGPSPELAQAANARGAILSEPDDRDAMKGGIIKRITGGDRIFTRALNENGGSMEMTFKTIMICNRIPDIVNVDKALINRFVIMPFMGVWNDTAPDKEEDQFKMKNFKIDPFFEAKIPELARGLLWIIVHYYAYYAEEGLQFPPIVKEYIKKHWEDNDYYLQFISEKVSYAYKDNDKKIIDEDALLAASDVYPHFLKWFKDYYPGLQVPTMAQMKADLCMSGRLGPQLKRSWVGIKVKMPIPELPGGGYGGAGAPKDKESMVKI